MITKLSVLYAGQVELDNVGRDGAPADERTPLPARRLDVFPEPRPARHLAREPYHRYPHPVVTPS
jgi:hypothetical protein